MAAEVATQDMQQMGSSLAGSVIGQSRAENQDLPERVTRTGDNISRINNISEQVASQMAEY